MPDYSRAKIYKLTCDDTNLIYIGSTCQKYLCGRLSNHGQDFKKNGGGTTSRKLYEAGNVKIELIELYPCEIKEELLKRERYWMDQTNCVNIQRPYTTVEETKETRRQYQVDNREDRKSVV